MMFEPKRLHPTAILFFGIKTLRQSLVGLLPVIILALNDGFVLYTILGILFILIVVVGQSFLSWYRFTYTLEEDQLLMEQGVLIRKKRTISKHRIQSIDLTQTVVHRIFGLTKVQIETAGSDSKTDAALSSLTLEDGKWLHDQLKIKQESETSAITSLENSEQDSYPKRVISLKSLIIAGSTSGSFGVLISLVALLTFDLDSFVPESFYNKATTWFIGLAMEMMVLLSLLSILSVWILGIFSTVIKYGNFSITRYDRELFITRGLLEKKQTTIPLNRIQAVGIKESLIRQPFGFATLYVEIAGGEINKNGDAQTLLFPMLKKQSIPTFLKEILPEYQNVPNQFSPVSKRSLPYYLLKMIWLPMLAIIVGIIFVPNWIYIPGIALVGAALIGFSQYKTNGVHLSKEQLTIQFRLLTKETVLLKQQRIQAFEQNQHLLYKWHRLANMKLSVLNNFTGRHYTIPGLEMNLVNELANWFSYKKE
ncbi:PH domain-containing protein [Aquibacillus kalidii]|uniref:PH domain-containing protein n=1 Tax=Aquibacillus kalidii TaxID=2762597 RepID=UPI001645B381|nr:PH domain-containing protein [Aquibacillus kalidii]